MVINHDLAAAGGIDGLRCQITRQRIRDALNSGWITLTDSSIVLMPITKLPDELQHQGRETIQSRRSKLEHNVFGDPQADAPTYLATRGAKCESDAWTDWDRTLRPQDKLLLTIDTTKLLDSRLVYLDPESFSYSPGPGTQGDKMGEMFFVVGGIPWAAIKTLTRPWEGIENLVHRWPR